MRKPVREIAETFRRPFKLVRDPDGKIEAVCRERLDPFADELADGCRKLRRAVDLLIKPTNPLPASLRRQAVARRERHKGHEELYPLGFCNEITGRLFAILENNWNLALHPRPSLAPASIGKILRDRARRNKSMGRVAEIVEGPGRRVREILLAAQEKGAPVEKFYGIHRGNFQWGIQAGTRMLNVSCDAEGAKDPVWYGKTAESGFPEMDAWGAFLPVKRTYHGASVWRNDVLPFLAPIFPFVAQYPDGRFGLLHTAHNLFGFLDGFADARNAYFSPDVAGVPPALRARITERLAKSDVPGFVPPEFLDTDGDAAKAERMFARAEEILRENPTLADGTPAIEALFATWRAVADGAGQIA